MYGIILTDTEVYIFKIINRIINMSIKYFTFIPINLVCISIERASIRKIMIKQSKNDHFPSESNTIKILSLFLYDNLYAGTNHTVKSITNFKNGQIPENKLTIIAKGYTPAFHCSSTVSNNEKLLTYFIGLVKGPKSKCKPKMPIY